MAIFDALGFQWDRRSVPGAVLDSVKGSVPSRSVERACFRFLKMLPEFVWDASVLEGNPFTFPEVKTLLDGVTVGGHKLSDQNQVLNLAQSSKRLLAMIRDGDFELSKPVFLELGGIVGHEEALEWGVFRGEGSETSYTPDVSLGEQGRHTPLPTVPGAPELNRVFAGGIAALQQCEPFERALAFFLFGALQQFLFDGNKRTCRLMMNGILMSHGMDAISVPAAKSQEFNEKMVGFYVSRDGTEMMDFLVGCHPDASPVRCPSDGARS